MYNPTNDDIRLVSDKIKNVRTKIEILNYDDTVQGVITGIIADGTHTIDSSSSVRRTFSITILPDADSLITVENFSKLIDSKYRLYTCVYDRRNDDYIEYSNGVYLIQNMDFSYDAASNTLKIQASDLMTKYNGAISGNLPALKTKISPYKVDDMGNPVLDANGNLTYYAIKDELIGYLQYCGINKYMILEDIGEYRGIQKYNKDYLSYRNSHPQWNTIPYEIDLSTTDSYETVFNKLCTFYFNYDYAFDEEGIFVLKMIPSTYEDDIVLDNNLIQQILLTDNSENVSIDLTTVKNVSIVWGKCFSPDYYAETSIYSTVSNVYGVSLSNISAYENENVYAINIEEPNQLNASIDINGMGSKMIYDEETNSPIAANTLTAGVWCFKYKNNVMYLLGQYQIHAVNILSNGKNPSYTKEFFKNKYNCDNISITVIPDSQFAIEEIGLREKSYNDDTCNNLSSNSLALSYAEYLTWKTARITDKLSLTCTLIPWLREYTKISYKPKNAQSERQYMIQNIAHDFGAGTTTITAYRFYPLYDK